MRAVLTDIEGTTSSIAFVKDVLFPYARRELPGFVAAYGKGPEVARWLAQVPGDPVATLLGWIDEDRKETPLKALQGLIWRQGYARGAFRAHVYPDAAAKLRAWHAAGVRLAVYSSGSVAAQQLLFAHSVEGDLAPLFDAWFDTETGGKRDPASYRRIAAELGADTTFLSDIVAELDAAREAGLATVLVDRREDHPEPRLTSGHPRVDSFAALD
jgi:enolase-phosphatase E1